VKSSGHAIALGRGFTLFRVAESAVLSPSASPRCIRAAAQVTTSSATGCRSGYRRGPVRQSKYNVVWALIMADKEDGRG